jgi:Ice-binding-like
LLILLCRSKYGTEVKNMRRSVLSVSLAALVVLIWPATALAATLPRLGTAGNYAVLAGSTISNTGPSWITGKVGLSPGKSITGFPPGVSGHRDVANGAALQAKNDLITAYNDAAGETPFKTISGNLGNRTLVAGTYRSTGALAGTLILNGGGVYVFQMPSTLVTASSSRVILTNGAQPCDVFWQVTSSATIGSASMFVGTIMALQSITMVTKATLEGRALARNGAVTLDTNRIIQPGGCGFSAPPIGKNISAQTGLPLSLGFSLSLPSTVGLPSTGVPLELRGEFPWLLVIGAGGGLGAIALGVSSARRRRRTT